MGLSEKLKSQIEEYVQLMMDTYEIPGLALAVSKGDRVVYACGFGRKNEEKEPVTPNTMFGIASITKSFTGLAITQLVEKGKMSFDDPIIKYLPEFDVPEYDASAITVHHFLNHTSGIPPLTALGHSMRGNTKPDKEHKEEEKEQEVITINTVEDLLAFIAKGDFKMLGPAGQYCSYSNDAYGLLGYVVEAASGQPYDVYVKEHILKPLDMHDSTFSLAELQKMDDVTSLYYKDEEGKICVSDNWQEAPPYTACGWLRSNAKDMIKYMQMYANDGQYQGKQIVSPKGIAKMMAQTNPLGSRNYYGYGLRMQPYYAETTLVEHSGGLKGVSSNGGFVPEIDLAAVVLTNLGGIPTGKIWLGVANIMMGLDADHPRSVYEKDVIWTEATMDRFSGTYVSGEGAVAEIKRDKEQLVATVRGKTYTIRPFASEEGIVVMDGIETEVKFYCNDRGKAWAIGFGGRIIQKAEED